VPTSLPTPTTETDPTPDVDPTPDAATPEPSPEPASSGSATPEPASSGSGDTLAPLGGLLAPADSVTTWTGVIDGDIEVSVWLAQSDELVRGEITYQAEPIQLLGRRYASGEGYFLHEFGPDGKVSGTLILGVVQDGTVSEATWGDSSLELELTNTTAATTDLFVPAISAGTYRYSFPPFGSGESDEPCCGPTGVLEISEVRDSEVTIEFSNHRGAPSFNLAVLPEVTVARNGNVALYSAGDGEFVDCAIEVTVFDGFAYVQHLDDRYDCEFGFGAGVEGVYAFDGS